MEVLKGAAAPQYGQQQCPQQPNYGKSPGVHGKMNGCNHMEEWEGIMPSELSPSEKDTYDFTHMWK